MTTDGIIRMAQEAGMGNIENVPSLVRYLERFFLLAVAVEREACADLCYKTPDDNAFVNHYRGTRMDLRCSELIRARGKE